MEFGSKEAGGSDIHISAVFRPYFYIDRTSKQIDKNTMPQGKQAPTGFSSLSSSPPLSRKHIESQNAYSF